MTILNDADRVHLGIEAVERLPQAGEKGIHLKQRLKDKLVEHRQYIEKYGEDLPEIRNWKWGSGKGNDRAITIGYRANSLPDKENAYGDAPSEGAVRDGTSEGGRSFQGCGDFFI